MPSRFQMSRMGGGLAAPRRGLFPNAQQMQAQPVAQQQAQPANNPYYQQPAYSPGMQTGTGGGWSASYGNAPPQPNPYIESQIATQAQQGIQNFQRNVIPSIRGGAIAAGGFGGSRQGIAEGIAAGDMMNGLNASAMGLRSGAYESERNRQLQAHGIDSNQALGYLNSDRQYDLGRQGAANARHGIDVGASTARDVANIGAGASRDVANIGATTAMRGQDMSLTGQREGYENQRGIASMTDSTNRYLGDQQSGTQRYLGDQSNTTQQRGQDMSLAGQREGFDTQRFLGGMANTTAQRGQDIGLQGQMAGYDTQRGIATMNDGTNRYLGDQQAGTSRYGVDRNFALGELNNATNRDINNRQMDVNMRGQDITWQNNTNETAQREQAMRDAFYLGNRGQDLTQLGIGTNFYSDLLRTGAAGSGTTGVGGDDGGFNWQQAIGGGLGGMQLWNNLFGARP